MREGNAKLLRALVFAASVRPRREIAAALGDVATACDQTVLHQGPRCSVVRNAAIAALSTMPTATAGAQLGRLHQMLKYKTARRIEGEAVLRAARSTGASTEQFLEAVVPDYGLAIDGTLELIVAHPRRAS